jgi:hypothetical protein
VSKGVAACVDVDFAARAAVAGGAPASACPEVALLRELGARANAAAPPAT